MSSNDINLSSISLEALAGYISEVLNGMNLSCILVGGACVSIYSNNRYQSYDLDFVTYDDMKKVRECLKGIGFTEDKGFFRHSSCKWFIEFVAPPVAVGTEPINEFNHRATPLGELKLLTPTDCVKDRLASYYHWDDIESLEQALEVCRDQEVDFEEIERWSAKEKQSDKFLNFQSRLN